MTAKFYFLLRFQGPAIVHSGSDTVMVYKDQAVTNFCFPCYDNSNFLLWKRPNVVENCDIGTVQDIMLLALRLQHL